MITFFEGIAKKDSKVDKNKFYPTKVEKNKFYPTKVEKNKLKHLLDPKTLGFALCVKNSHSKYMYDVNIVYTHKNKITDPTDSNFTLLLFHPETKIYVEVNKYELPKYEESEGWIKEFYMMKDEQIDNIINKNLIILP